LFSFFLNKDIFLFKISNTESFIMTFPRIYVLYSELIHLFHFSPFYFSLSW
jgi:hypothetical protein